MLNRTDDRVRCSFCGKTQDQVRKLIAGSNNVFICDECIDLCAEILEEELGDEDDDLELDGINLLKPKEIKAFLDEYVIGQDAAKKSACCFCVQSLQTNHIKEKYGCGCTEEQHSSLGTDRIRQDLSGTDPGKNFECAFCYC